MLILTSKQDLDLFVYVRRGIKRYRIFREEWDEVERALCRANERARNDDLIKKALKKRKRDKKLAHTPTKKDKHEF